jgi:hypothetical protein
LDAILRDTLMRRLTSRLAPTEWDAMLERVLARELDPYSAAAQLLSADTLGTYQ